MIKVNTDSLGQQFFYFFETHHLDIFIIYHLWIQAVANRDYGNTLAVIGGTPQMLVETAVSRQ